MLQLFESQIRLLLHKCQQILKVLCELRLGAASVIPIFSNVSGNGNNATYTIVRFEGIRILSVKLTGPMKKKHVTIQPAPMVARRAIYSEEEYAETDYLYTPVMLVE